MKRLLLALAAIATLAGCGARNADYEQPAPDVARGSYVHGGPPSLTLITIRTNDSGKGSHTALMINAEERVIFDPAGSFRHAQIRREGDVLVGISPIFWEGFRSMHARATHRVETQTVIVSPEVASQALALAYRSGAAPSAYCARNTSSLLKQLPGFEGLRSTWFPTQLEESFIEVTGAETTIYYEDYTPPGGLPANGVLGVDRTTVPRVES
ncbi:MAG: hypothetical protein GYB51_03295 [Rhodobacteraceae bacterium]|nr:hypothetical protein [Paracoccaceae bacterium]